MRLTCAPRTITESLTLSCTARPLTRGVESLMDYMRVFAQHSFAESTGKIRCPTPVCLSEDDLVAAFAEDLYAALRCQKTLMRFAAAEGAGDHCEMKARTLFHQRTFDWLDDTLGWLLPIRAFRTSADDSCCN